MSKLQDLFTHARRAQSSGGMGFLGKNKPEAKPRAAALVVSFSQITAGRAEAALKAGADGLLFRWDGKDNALPPLLKQEINSAKASNENLVSGLQITGGWDSLDQESLSQLKDQGIQYIVLPFDAPARLLAMEFKDIELVVTVPMRTGDLYPIFVRSLTAFDSITAVYLDFGISSNSGSITIEEVLQYRAVREALRFPAFLNVKSGMNEADAYTLMTLGVQAIVLPAHHVEETMRQQIKTLHDLLEKVHREEKDTSFLPARKQLG